MKSKIVVLMLATAGTTWAANVAMMGASVAASAVASMEGATIYQRMSDGRLTPATRCWVNFTTSQTIIIQSGMVSSSTIPTPYFNTCR